MFTGDESGNWLFRALESTGFASQASSVARGDGMVLTDCFITATCRCAPPQNKLQPEEVRQCRPFLLRELAHLTRVRVVVGLGRIGFGTALASYRSLGTIAYTKTPAFAHGARYDLGPLTFLASFHPSQQNNFTVRLTRPMLHRVFREARNVIAGGRR